MKPLRALLLSALVLSAAAAWFSLRALEASRTVPAVGDARAFLNAQWGMSPEEVAAANGARLQEVPSGRYADDEAGGGRDRSYEQNGVRFLGREARAVYTFRDERLRAYHVFISDRDAAALEADMRRFLERRFGGRYSEPDEGALKRVWHFRDRIVNYWFYPEELALGEKYRAGYGVSHRPLESD
jgi:hypothetical protein